MGQLVTGLQLHPAGHLPHIDLLLRYYRKSIGTISMRLKRDVCSMAGFRGPSGISEAAGRISAYSSASFEDSSAGELHLEAVIGSLPLPEAQNEHSGWCIWAR